MKNTLASLLFLIISLLAASCEKEELESNDALEILYKTYKDGEISECQLNGELVYTASLNMVDSSTKIYDKNGGQIGECNYAWGTVDAICEQLTACAVVYRVENHVSGAPAVDKYGLRN